MSGRFHYSEYPALPNRSGVEPTSGLEPLASSLYELDLGALNWAEKSLIYRERGIRTRSRKPLVKRPPLPPRYGIRKQAFLATKFRKIKP
jgi:hypothetical protein